MKRQKKLFYGSFFYCNVVIRKIWVISFLLIIVSCSKGNHTHNDFIPNDHPDQSKVAFAYPIEPISIDGSINDWPSHIKSYPLAALLENKIDNPDDLDASFKVGYASKTNSIFIAISVKDDVHIASSNEKGLNDEQDQCLLYLDKAHHPKGSGVNVYSFNEFFKDIDDASKSWDPSIKDATWDDVTTAVKRDNNTTTYEIEIKFDENLIPGRTIGLDIMIYDNDIKGDDSEVTRVSWKDNDGKTNVPFKLGHIMLMKEKQQTGILEGKLVWKKDSLGGAINKIRISFESNPTLWIREFVDSLGNYKTQLPTGSYNISSEWGIYNTEDVKYKVSKNKVDVEVLPNKTVTASNLEISTTQLPEITVEQGVLFENGTEKYTRIDNFVKDYMDFYDVPGISLAIIEEGKVTHHKTYGVSNTFSQEKVNENTIFEAASITKTVFAFAVNRLAEKKIIDLDKPLCQYLPFEAIAHDDRYQLITARHVLSHQTGFPNWRSQNPDGQMTINFKPGTAFGYSGEGFEYLKRVVEHITQKDIEVTLNEEVIKPLDLKNIYFSKSDYLFDVVSHGHDDFYPHKKSLPNKAGMAWSMHTEALSFSKFAISLLEQKGLSKKTYQDMFSKHTRTDKYDGINPKGWESYFGLGLQLEGSPFGLSFGHGGNNGDFKCEFKVYKELKKGFVIFTNGNTGDQLTNKALEQFLITGKM